MHIIAYNHSQSLMELLSSMLSIVKNVTDTDREFKLLREKLVFSLKKGDAALNKYNKEHHVQSWVAEHLESRLRDGREKLAMLDKLLSNSQNQGISLTDKFKLSLPFNNERDKINQTIDDLKTAIEEVLNNNIPMDPASASKRKLQAPPPVELQVDSEIDELYEMGPTIQENNALQFAQEFTKNHTIQLEIQAIGSENVVKTLEKTNRSTKVEHTCERVSKETSLELFKLGRKNFKPEYKTLKQVYPDIDKISKEVHFTIKWVRVAAQDRSQLSEVSNRLQEKEQSQKKEEAEQFFSVPDQEHVEPDNGQVILQKEKRSLYRKIGEVWTRVEEEWFQVNNGEEVAVSLGKDMRPELAFKIAYQWK